jgi:Ca-activated chloride channel family protein
MTRDAQQELFGFAFADPWFLLGVPLLLLLWAWVLGRRKAALGVASSSLYAGLPRTWRVRLLQLPVHLTGLALLCLSLAIARPQELARLPVTSEGVEILLVLDLSSSMSSKDMDAEGEQSRLDVAKEVALGFVEGRDSDRIGLVAFAYYPDLVCPATLDHEALERFLRPLEPKAQDSPENKTAIGAGLALAVKHLEESENPSRVVILLTDGVENLAYVSSEEATKLAKDAGVRVYTIGAGGGVQGASLFDMMAKPDFSGLRKIASETGAEFFEAANQEALSEVFERIDELETVEQEDPLYRADERFLPFLLAGAGLLFLALLLRGTILVATP